MLAHLRVSNLGVLEEVSIEPAEGLTVITGETGAGKTLLLGGLRLLLGEKADSSVVGPFSDSGQADGLFAMGDEEVGVTRVVPAEGRSRAHIDGSIASADALQQRVGRLVEIVGQHDQLSLKQGARVLSLVDGSLDEEGSESLDAYGVAWARLQDVRRRERELGGNEMALRQELDLVRFQATEIDAASLEPEEDRDLEAEASRLDNILEIRGLFADSMNLGDELSEQTGELVSRLRKLHNLDASQSHLLQQADSLSASLAELNTDLRQGAERLDVDPERAEQVDQRLTLIGDLKRKYGSTLAEVIQFGDKARARQEELERLLEAASRIESDLTAALAGVEEAGARLTDSRRRAAEAIAEESMRHLADLGLKKARLLVAASPLKEPGARGVDQMEILFSSDVHLQPGPIASVASGGELSRLVLSFRLATRAPGAQTIVFDEVDAGVGGATALALGRKLEELARSSQVLCVTHLPQVAAFADRHYVVQREGSSAWMRVVSDDERVSEISRMLAGLPGSEAGRETAIELLSVAASG